MCSPVFIPVAIAGMAAVYQGVATLYGAKMQRSMLSAQHDIERQKYRETLEAGRYEAKKAGIQVHQALGAQKASMGASGTVSTTGSNLDVLAENAALGQMDVEIIKQNYQRQAYTHLQNITMLENQRKQVKYYAKVGMLGTLLTLSSSTAQTLSNAFQYQGNQQLVQSGQIQTQQTRMRTGSYSNPAYGPLPRYTRI